MNFTHNSTGAPYFFGRAMAQENPFLPGHDPRFEVSSPSHPERLTLGEAVWPAEQGWAQARCIGGRDVSVRVEIGDGLATAALTRGRPATQPVVETLVQMAYTVKPTAAAPALPTRAVQAVLAASG
jgi:hypothetical protein